MVLTKNTILEGIQIKKGSKLLLEAFGSGKSADVAIKISNILSRKIGYNILMSDVPFAYENSYGTFAGYLGAVSNGMFIKINFKLAGSDSIESFDMYLDGFSDNPSYTVETTGLNIIQIVNLMVENLVDDGEVDEKVLTEKANITDIDKVVSIIDKMVKTDKNMLKDLQNLPAQDIFNSIWYDYISDKPNYQSIKFYLFSKALKQYLLSKGMTNRTFRNRKKGSKEREIIDPVMSAQFDDILETISWQDKFKILEGSIKAVIDGDIQALYLFGDPGSGKSFTVEDYMKKSGLDYKLYRGGVKSMDELIRILYNQRDNKIIVFDDFDSVLKQKDSANIFKAVLENKPSRTVTYVDVARKGGMKDVPQVFDFSSGVIFISNERKLNSAIASRAITLEITLSNEQVIDKIKNSLKEYRPEIAMSVKEEAIKYLQEISEGVRTVDYRTLDKVIVAMKIMPNNWKKTALMFIKAMD